MRRWRFILPLVVVAVLAYGASPFLGLYQLGAALHAADAEAALERIDLASVRRSIVGQIVEEAGRDETIGKELDKLGDVGRQLALRAAAAEFDRRLAEAITPALLRQLIVEGTLPADLGARSALDRGAAAGPVERGDTAFNGVPANPLRFIQDWEFSSLRKFKTVLGDPAAPQDWTGLSLRLSRFQWRLAEVRLSPSVLARVRPLIQQAIERLRP